MVIRINLGNKCIDVIKFATQLSLCLALMAQVNAATESCPTLVSIEQLTKSGKFDEAAKNLQTGLKDIAAFAKTSAANKQRCVDAIARLVDAEICVGHNTVAEDTCKQWILLLAQLPGVKPISKLEPTLKMGLIYHLDGQNKTADSYFQEASTLAYGASPTCLPELYSVNSEYTRYLYETGRKSDAEAMVGRTNSNRPTHLSTTEIRQMKPLVVARNPAVQGNFMLTNNTDEEWEQDFYRAVLQNFKAKLEEENKLAQNMAFSPPAKNAFGYESVSDIGIGSDGKLKYIFNREAFVPRTKFVELFNSAVMDLDPRFFKLPQSAHVDTEIEVRTSSRPPNTMLNNLHLQARSAKDGRVYVLPCPSIHYHVTLSESDQMRRDFLTDVGENYVENGGKKFVKNASLKTAVFFGIDPEGNVVGIQLSGGQCSSDLAFNKICLSAVQTMNRPFRPDQQYSLKALYKPDTVDVITFDYKNGLVQLDDWRGSIAKAGYNPFSLPQKERNSAPQSKPINYGGTFQ